MTFDPYANQGDTSAWDPEAAAATKRASERIFTADQDGHATEDSTGEDPSEEAENPGGEGEGTAVKQDPHVPEEVPDPDLTTDP